MALTQEQVERAARLLKQGLSYAQIATELGVTRNVVLGKMHRAKLAHLTQRPQPQRAKNSGAFVPQSRRKAVAIGGAQSFVALEEPLEELPSDAVEPESAIETPVERKGLPLSELKAHSCRYPHGDPQEDSFGFCGARAVHGSYCGAHAQLCYEPSRGRR